MTVQHTPHYDSISTQRPIRAGAIDVPLAVDATRIRKRYGDRDALRGVDLAVPFGQLHGLLGPNGAGKTTLMRILLGLVRSDDGTVRLLGSAVPTGAGSLPAGVAGFVDAPSFYPYLSGRQNLALCARLDDGAGAHRRRVSQSLDRVGLSAAADVRISGYSAGMRQRLGVAAALLRSPRLLILDEPTTALDPAGAREVRALARDLASEGAAILWSSHDMAEVEELCERVTVVREGCVVYAGAVEELRERAPAAMHVMQTSNDIAAAGVAAQLPGLRVRLPRAEGEGLEIAAERPMLDAYVIALGREGIAIRLLEQHTRSLESLFLELTEQKIAAIPTAVNVPAVGARPVVAS